ncbi:hypothetical protein [Desulforhopalus sp. 52FAK]
MKLLQAKLRGTGPLISSNWFQLSSGLNQFHFADPLEGTLFLRSLQTLNPLFSCSAEDPFKNLPHYEKRGNYQKHIQPEKRTIALGVFAATATLVHELGELDQNLYETDRIEIGRRLDYSRWLNFVELSSSTRWEEIKENICALLELLPQQNNHKNRAKAFTQSLDSTDRIKGTVADKLLFFIKQIEKNTKNKDIYSETVELIERDKHFQTARQIVLKRLPLFIYFNPYGDISPLDQTSQNIGTSDHIELSGYLRQMNKKISTPSNVTTLKKIISGIELAISASTRLSRMDPIFFFDSPEKNTPTSEHNKLQQLILSTAEKHQCFYVCHKGNFFSPESTGKNYSEADLHIAPQVPNNS